MNKITTVAALVAVSLTALSCATSNTTFQSTWRNPDEPAIDLERKVVVVFMSNNDRLHHRAEDAMAAELTARGASAVTAHAVLSDAGLRDSNAAREEARRQGFDAAM